MTQRMWEYGGQNPTLKEMLGITDTTGPSSTALVSTLLTEVLQIDKDVLIHCSHRCLPPRNQGGEPRTIVAKLNYYQDCVELLHHAHSQSLLGGINRELMAIFLWITLQTSTRPRQHSWMSGSCSKDDGIRHGILFPPRLRIAHNVEDKEFIEPDKIMAC